MPGIDHAESSQDAAPLTELPFKPVTKQHILNCSYEHWYPRYKQISLESRLIPLTPAFLEYLREDGLWVPDDEDTPYEETQWSTENADKVEDPDFLAESKPNTVEPFADIHQQIKDVIANYKTVVPKLNWSSPKDVSHMNQRQNTLVCDKPSHIYLLLKSSMFVNFDLERAFQDCAETGESSQLTLDDIPYTIVLRKEKSIDIMFEFRCFVRDRTLIAICQRALKFFDYPEQLLQKFKTLILSFFGKHLEQSFEDPNFVFDIYIPEPHNKVFLIDINPWAPRTDPILFSWLDLLRMDIPPPLLGIPDSTDADLVESSTDETDDDTDIADEEVPFQPEFKIVKKNDPEAWNISTAPYSAHKMPRDVVTAAEDGMSAAELLEVMRKTMNGEVEPDSDDE